MKLETQGQPNHPLYRTPNEKWVNDIWDTGQFKYYGCTPDTTDGIHYFHNDIGVQPDLVPHLKPIRDENHEFGVVQDSYKGHRFNEAWIDTKGATFIKPIEKGFTFVGVHRNFLIHKAKYLRAFLVRNHSCKPTDHTWYGEISSAFGEYSFYGLESFSTLKPRELNKRHGEIYAIGRVFNVDGKEVRLWGADEYVIGNGIEKKISIDIKVDNENEDELIKKFGNGAFGSSCYLRQAYLSKLNELIHQEKPLAVIERKYSHRIGDSHLICGGEDNGKFSYEHKIEGIIELVK